MKKPYIGVNRSSFKLIITKESTTVDEKNNCVIHSVHWKLDIPTILRRIMWAITDGMYLEGHAKGVAICHKEDKFDSEIGKKMARAIAESNAYTNASKRVKKLMYNVFRIANQINEQELDFRIKANDIVVHNKEYMDGLIGK